MTVIDRTLGSLVVENPARSRVLEELGLDYCCGGKKTLRESCVAKSLVPEQVMAQLEKCDQTDTAPTQDPATLTPGLLADHIESTHHAYLKRELPRLSQLLDKVVAAHGRTNPYLHELKAVFEPFRSELEQHMAKEEQVLFPWIRQKIGSGMRGPIAVMEAEHEAAGAALETFRVLTAGYSIPETACGTFRALMDGLATLERDMHQHVHLENNVLFPKALEE